jgi:hypothetical protein
MYVVPDSSLPPPPEFPTGSPVVPPIAPPSSPPYQPPSGRPPQPTSGSVGAIWLWGSVFGAAFGLVAALIGTLLTQVVVRSVPANRTLIIQLLTTLERVNFVLWVAIASFLAGALSKRFASGIIAGVLLVLVTQGLSFLFALPFLPQVLPVRGIIQIALRMLIAAPASLLLGAGLGAGCGALGALVGRAMARRSQAQAS